MSLTHVDLFSGIGGFALAARWNGIETVQFVEIDPFCCKVLEKNFSGVPIHHDIQTFTNAKRGRAKTENESIQRERESHNIIRFGLRDESARDDRVFLLTGGFPCQPFSCAGKRKGTGDDRYLWPEMLRVIQEFNPRWVIAENVPGIINLKSVVEQSGDADMEGETLDDYEGDGDSGVLISILTDLEQSGYSVQVFVVPACAVGAPHRRDRVWIVGYATKSGYRAAPEAYQRAKEKWGSVLQQSLTQQIAMLPTPQHGDYRNKDYDTVTSNLPNMLKGTGRYAEMLPTPAPQMCLGGATEAIRTPTGWKRVSNQGVSHGANMHDVIKTVGKNLGLKLQPAFVEWMQGFPIGWTDLKHSETP